MCMKTVLTHVELGELRRLFFLNEVKSKPKMTILTLLGQIDQKQKSSMDIYKKKTFKKEAITINTLNDKGHTIGNYR